MTNDGAHLPYCTVKFFHYVWQANFLSMTVCFFPVFVFRTYGSGGAGDDRNVAITTSRKNADGFEVVPGRSVAYPSSFKPEQPPAHALDFIGPVNRSDMIRQRLRESAGWCGIGHPR